MGYSVVKMKIGGADLAEDLKRIEAVLEVLDGDGSRLAVDVNGRFDLQTALEYGRAIEPYGLFWYEEIGDPLDYRLNAIVSEHYSGPIATGENLFSLQDARNLIRYGGMRPDRDYIQVDPALSYGLTEYLRVQDMLRAARLVLAPLHPARRAPVLAAHRRGPQARRQRVLPRASSSPPAASPTTPWSSDSRVGLTEIPGIGFEGKAAFYKVLRELHH